MRTITDLITGALVKIRAARAGDVPSPEDLQLGLDGLNELLDLWNLDDRAAYSTTPSDFTLVANRSPHTIGPSGSKAGPADPDFVVTQRPVAIRYAAVNIGSNVYREIRVRDAIWYQRQTMPALTLTFPTDLYYAPDWTDPNGLGTGYGNVYFWGVPTSAYTVRLWLRVLLAQVAIGDTFSLPQGYYRALKLTLAESIAEDFGQAVSPTLAMQAREARDAVFGNNVTVPRIRTSDVRTRGQSSGSRLSSFLSRNFS